MIMRFRLISGVHSQGDKLYEDGSIVESDKPLDKLFEGKFVRLSSDGLPSDDLEPEIPSPSTVKVKKEVKKEVKESKKKKVDVLSIEYDDFGENVTKDFPLAVEYGFVVCRLNNWYTVIEPEDDIIQNDKRLRKAAINPLLEELVSELIVENDEEDEGE